MFYVVTLAFLWAAVGALVFFVRAKMTLPQRLGLTIATSIVFGMVGWIDVSSIVHAVRSGPAVIAKESGQARYRVDGEYATSRRR
jgi:hypothetical protein